MSTSYRIITERDAFLGLRDAWDDLARASGIDHAFMRHAWFRAWWEHMPHGAELAVLTAWEGDLLVAALPTILKRDTRKGATFTMLSLMVSGITPRCNFLVRPGTDPGAAFAGVFAIPGWDVAEFKQFEADHPLTRDFVAFLEGRGGAVVEKGAVSPYGILPPTWQEFEKSRSKGYRKRFRNSLNRCQGAASFGIERIDTYADLEARFADLLTVSRNSWKAEGGTDLVTQGEMGEFLRQFARDTADEGLWVVYLMELEGRPVAFDYYVRHAGRMVGLRWEYDDGCRYYMPGVVVHVQAIKDLIAEAGGGELDLAGTETDFKSGLVDQARLHVDITFGSGSVRAKMLMMGKRALEKAHQLSGGGPED